ncbi:MAG: DNA polymerase Y family protein [Dehalococcoidia bacterium]
MLYACLTVPALALEQRLAEQPALRSRAVALADDSGLRVAEVTAEAALRGVRRGITLREAVAFCPRLAVLEPRPASTRWAAGQLVEAAASVSPLIEEAEPGTVFADLRGLEGLYPQPGQLQAALLAAAPRELPVRLGVAGQRFTALVAAKTAAPQSATWVLEGESAAFLAGQAVEWLPLDADHLERLRLFGITSLGEFAALPMQAAQAQFGAQGRRAWLAARGEDPERLHPRRVTLDSVHERVRPEAPLISREAILQGARQLLRHALRQPRAAGRFVRQIRLRAISEDEQLWERTQPLREPTNDRTRLWTVVRTQFEYAELPGPIAELDIELGGLTTETGRQPGLFVDHLRRREQLDEMVRHLRMRFGHSPVAQVVEVEPWSRLPERRYALMDYDP